MGQLMLFALFALFELALEGFDAQIYGLLECVGNLVGYEVFVCGIRHLDYGFLIHCSLGFHYLESDVNH